MPGKVEPVGVGMKLTEEQKEQVVAEVRHYLMMDCYDFAVSVGDFTIRAGELAAGDLSDCEEEWAEHE